MAAGPLGLIAGTGALPRLIAEAARARGEGAFVVRYEGIDAPWADAHPHADLPFEKPGRLFAALRAAGCTRICFAGAMTRPKLDPLRFDLKALSLLTRVPALLKKGDDAMLRGLAAILEGEGFVMVAAHDQLSGLLAPEGVLGAVGPTEDDRADAARAAAIVRALGAVDVGQGAAVAGGLCLGVEAIAGTDALLSEVARLPAALRPEGARGVLFKAPKPGQDWRLDLPAVGPETVRRAAEAGLGGVAVAAGGVLVLGLEETAAEADRLGLFLWGRAADVDAGADPGPVSGDAGRGRPLRLYLIAGEASGDRLGAPLIRALRAARDVDIRGIGGEQMQAAGLAPLFPSSDLSVMGLAEVLPRLPLILRRLRETAADIAAFRPDALITIDSPGFSLRAARRAKARDPELRAIHYVAPSVWAWRPGRAAKMARYVDHVLALLPFEPPLMQAAGMTCDFVGHPAVNLHRADAAAQAAFRAELGFGARPLLCVLPGSRAGEVARLRAPFGETLARLRARIPDLAVVMPAAPGVADPAAEAARAWPGEVHVLDPRGLAPEAAETRKFLAMAASDAALAASGTVALELAAMGVPQVIAYRVNALTAFIVQRLLTIDSANLVNLLVGGKPVPEFLQDRLVPADVAEALAALLVDPAAAAAQRAAADRALELLGRDGEPPSARAARSVLAAIDRRA